MIAYINGEFVAEKEAKISINDRGWLYGDGIFETLRTYDGRVFKAVEHLDRLERSASLTGIKLPLSSQEILSVIDELLFRERPADDLIIRVTVSRGVGGVGLYPAEPIAPTVVMQLRELPHYPDDVFTAGWSMITSKTRRNNPKAIDPQIKSTNFLNNILAKREAVTAGANEALMLNLEGYVAESSVSNFFIVKDGALVTPPITVGILPGVTRESVMDIARKAGLSAKEMLFKVSEVYSADEAFLTLTSAGLIPVVALDGRPIGDGRPGPLVRQLRRLYREYLDEFIKKGRVNG